MPSTYDKLYLIMTTKLEWPEDFAKEKAKQLTDEGYTKLEDLDADDIKHYFPLRGHQKAVVGYQKELKKKDNVANMDVHDNGHAVGFDLRGT